MKFTNDPIAYATNQAAEQASEERRAEYDRVCPPPRLGEGCPALGERVQAMKLGLFAQHLISDRDFLVKRADRETIWQSDTQEISQLARKAAVAMGPIIAEVLEAKARHEALAEQLRQGAAVQENRS